MSLGSITIIGALPDPHKRHSFGVIPPGMVMLAVQDTGHGMPPSVVSRIFEPLFTTKRTGTGLGLAVAQQVIVSSGGTMHVSSVVGEGTTFFILLKAAELEEQTEAASASGPATAGSSPRTVLLVEDDEIVANGLRELLELNGLTVTVSDSGHATLDFLGTCRPDAIILDIGLPDISGIALYERIVELHPGLPVIFSTAHADSSKIQSHPGNPVAFLRKPYDAAALFEALAEVSAPL